MLISILACSLGFHAITSERNLLLSLFGGFLARGGRKRGNRQTDRHTHEPSTVILAAHVRKGLTRQLQEKCRGVKHKCAGRQKTFRWVTVHTSLDTHTCINTGYLLLS